MSLRARLILAAAYILTVVVLALEIPLAVTIQRSANQDTESTLLSHALLVAARINDDVPTAGTDPAVPPKPPAAIQVIVADAAQATDTRIIVTDALGRVLEDSAEMAPVGIQYATLERPEFRSVFSIPGGTINVRRRYNSDVGQELLLVTVPVVHNRQVVGAVRISQPMGELRARIMRS